MPETVGLIGMGLLGSALAENLLHAGHVVRGFDVATEGKLAQHLEDVELMLEAARQAGAPVLATALHRQLLLAAVAAGWGERDNAAIMAVLERIAGLTG